MGQEELVMQNRGKEDLSSGPNLNYQTYIILKPQKLKPSKAAISFFIFWD